MAERLWNPGLGDDFTPLEARAEVALDRIMPIVQPVEILPAPPAEFTPVIDLHQPFQRSSIQIWLHNRSRLSGTLRCQEGNFSDGFT